MDENKKRALYVEVAKLYYYDKLTQDDIAARMALSRASVSRILSKCMEEGIVEISIVDTFSRMPDIAHRIKKKLLLKNVFIAPTNSDQDRTYRSIAEMSANYCMQVLKNGMLFGTTMGKMSYYVARNINNRNNLRVNTIQMLGATKSQYANTDSQSITIAFSSRLLGNADVLYAPLMVKSKLIKQKLLQEPLISATVRKYPQIDVALVEISANSTRIRPTIRTPWLSKSDTIQLQETGAVGFACGHYYNINGDSCNVGINDRSIGISRQLLCNIPEIIAMAEGPDSVDAVLGAQRAGFFHSLLIDESLARSLAIALDL